MPDKCLDYFATLKTPWLESKPVRSPFATCFITLRANSVNMTASYALRIEQVALDHLLIEMKSFKQVSNAFPVALPAIRRPIRFGLFATLDTASTSPRNLPEHTKTESRKYYFWPLTTPFSYTNTVHLDLIITYYGDTTLSLCKNMCSRIIITFDMYENGSRLFVCYLANNKYGFRSYSLYEQ